MTKKAQPMRLPTAEENCTGYVPCSKEECTHLAFYMPGPSGLLILPVIQSGSRDKQTGPVWSWNGSTEAPTLKPSILTQCGKWKCHSWLNDGQVKFLNDSTHEHAGKTLSLLDYKDD